VIRRISACAVIAFGCCLVLTVRSGHSRRPKAGQRRARAACRTARGLNILVSPRYPHRGHPVRILIASDKPLAPAVVELEGPQGVTHPTSVQHGGPPYWYLTQIEEPAVGRYRLRLKRDDKSLACASIFVRRRAKPARRGEDIWPTRRSWSRATERFYSAWIEQLFDAPPNARPSWKPLHEVIRDPKRNLLHNHLGLREDGPVARDAVVVKPDCADLPYYLRAYFAWKLGLPFGYRHCDRGNSRRPARCRELRTHEGMVLRRPGESAAGAFSRFLQRRVSYVHSGSGRTAPKDEQSDLYPVALTRDALRPGTVYVDPYGHLLVLAKWMPQTDERSGSLYAVDGHPDLSIGRKRFWRGAFLFSANIRGGAGGFKVFRPLVKRGDEIVPLTNAQLRRQRAFPRPSTQQYRLGNDGFYERMDEVINPRPLSPREAYAERLRAFYELIQERIDSVAAGEEYMAQTDYRVMPMPNGPRIFETRGPWENFSTPARDMRLLIAIDDVLSFPRRVVDRPERFALDAQQNPEATKKMLEQQYKRFAHEHAVEYIKSDATRKKLSVADVVARRKELEMAYNPNDCVERRWGATGGELDSCKRNAPRDQRQRMRRYRNWFATRNRPPIR
jgi:hypothetical protein